MPISLWFVFTDNQESRTELQSIQDNIQEKLDKRAGLREEKVSDHDHVSFVFLTSSSPQALLHLLLKISESVTRLESLLLIASPEQEDGFAGVGSPGMPNHDDGHEEKYVVLIS
jgi:hypothetical protein